VKLLAELSTRL